MANQEMDKFELIQHRERMIGEDLWSLRPTDLDWDQMIFEKNKIGATGQSIIYIRKNGEEIGREFSSSNTKWAADDLRKLYFRPGYGSWFSMTLTITPAGNGWETTYNYDQPPHWQMGGPSMDDYAYELYLFPRTEERIPEWFRNELTEPHWRPGPKTPPAEELRELYDL